MTFGHRGIEMECNYSIKIYKFRYENNLLDQILLVWYFVTEGVRHQVTDYARRRMFLSIDL